VLIAILSDTHMPRGSRRLPDACVAALRDADLILHAGDFSTASTLAAFELLGPPVVGVCGNVDDEELRRQLPGERVVEADGAQIAVLHDSGHARGRLERLRARFPTADAVVFGHSHLPFHEARDGFQIFNPGSPTERRRSPTRTMGLARAGGGRVSFELVDLGR
jgi:hypothetical protein